MKTQNDNRISRKLSNALTVEELIDELQNYPKDAKVVFACDYGDYCHTQQALPIETCDEIDLSNERIEESGYSRSGLALENLNAEQEEPGDDEPPTDGPEGEVVVILR